MLSYVEMRMKCCTTVSNTFHWQFQGNYRAITEWTVFITAHSTGSSTASKDPSQSHLSPYSTGSWFSGLSERITLILIHSTGSSRALAEESSKNPPLSPSPPPQKKSCGQDDKNRTGIWRQLKIDRLLFAVDCCCCPCGRGRPLPNEVLKQQQQSTQPKQH